MSFILTSALIAEGPADQRFLGPVIQRTLEDIAFSCTMDIEIFPITLINSAKGLSFIEKITKAAALAYNAGALILFVHVDADSPDVDDVLTTRFEPLIDSMSYWNDFHCKNLVAVIPVRMTEAWMLADKDKFKEIIYANLSNAALGISSSPEMMADPKQKINEALIISQEHLSSKRRKIEIAEIYQPLGQQIPLERLKLFNSYKLFWERLEQAFQRLNLKP